MLYKTDTDTKNVSSTLDEKFFFYRKAKKEHLSINSVQVLSIRKCLEYV